MTSQYGGGDAVTSHCGQGDPMMDGDTYAGPPIPLRSVTTQQT